MEGPQRLLSALEEHDESPLYGPVDTTSIRHRSREVEQSAGDLVGTALAPSFWGLVRLPCEPVSLQTPRD